MWRSLSLAEAAPGILLPGGRPLLTHVTQAIISGGFTRDKLNQGIEWAKRRYPMLQGKIKVSVRNEDNSGIPDAIFIPNVEDSIGIEVPVAWESVNESAFHERCQKLMEDELTTGELDICIGPLWRISVIHSENDLACLTLITYHAIDDQPSINALLHGMLASHAAPWPSDPLEMPPPLSDHGTAGCWDKFKLIWRLMKATSTNLPPDTPLVAISERKHTISSHVFTEEQTQSIIDKAHTAGTTVQGLLIASGVRSVSAFLSTPWGQKEPTQSVAHKISVASAIDARRRFPDLNVSEEAMAFYQTGAMQVFNASPSTGLLSLAVDAKRDLDIALRRDMNTMISMSQSPSSFLQRTLNDSVKPGTLGRSIALSVTNVGVDKHSAKHGDLTLESIRWASPVIYSGATFLIAAITVGARLCISISSCDAIVGDGATERFMASVIKDCLDQI